MALPCHYCSSKAPPNWVHKTHTKSLPSRGGARCIQSNYSASLGNYNFCWPLSRYKRSILFVVWRKKTNSYKKNVVCDVSFADCLFTSSNISQAEQLKVVSFCLTQILTHIGFTLSQHSDLFTTFRTAEKLSNQSLSYRWWTPHTQFLMTTALMQCSHCLCSEFRGCILKIS